MPNERITEEWLAEAYIEKDYTVISPDLFRKTMRKLALFNAESED